MNKNLTLSIDNPFCYTIHRFTRGNWHGQASDIYVNEEDYFTSDSKEALIKCYQLAIMYYRQHINEMLSGYFVVVRSEDTEGYLGVEIAKEHDEYKIAWVVVPVTPEIKS